MASVCKTAAACAFFFLESTFKDQINPKWQTAFPLIGDHRNWTSDAKEEEGGLPQAVSLRISSGLLRLKAGHSDHVRASRIYSGRVGCYSGG